MNLRSSLRAAFGVPGEKWDLRWAERRLAQSRGEEVPGKSGRAVEEVVPPAMERRRANTALGRVLGERLEQVVCHDAAFALEITEEVYLDWEI